MKSLSNLKVGQRVMITFIVIIAFYVGNIAYNLLKTGAGSNVAVGPFLLGVNAPVNILTSSSTVRRIINMAALTVIQANRAQ